MTYSVPPRISLIFCPADRAFHHADVDDDALVGVEVAVVDEGLERGVRVAGRGRDALDDGREHSSTPRPVLPLRAAFVGLTPTACSISP
jgi:hypothetical protein